MFGLKKKRDPVDVVDLTLLQKKGLLKSMPNSISSTETTQSDGMDFLSSFAASAAAASTTGNTTEQQNPQLQQTSGNDDITALKVIVDRISDRIMDFADKLQALERKIEMLQK